QAYGNTSSRSHIRLFNYNKDKGIYDVFFDVHDGTVNRSSPGYLSFNVWYRVIIYLDYNNKKSYLQIPNAGSKVFANYLSVDINLPTLIEDFYPATIQLFNTAHKVDISGGMKYNAVHSKYDNIKITALNVVPPEVVSLSVNNFLSEKFNLYANPATDIVNITNSENHLVNQVAVYDVAGKQLSIQTFNNESEIQLNVENLVSGVYMLHIQTNEGTVVKKLVKK